MSDWIDLTTGSISDMWRKSRYRRSAIIGLRPCRDGEHGACISFDGERFIHVRESLAELHAMLDVEDPNPLAHKPIASLLLSVRASNCLESAGIYTLADLTAKQPDQLLEIRNFGSTTLDEVRERLHEVGLSLRGDRLQAWQAVN